MRTKYIFIDFIKNFRKTKPLRLKNYTQRVIKFNLRNNAEKKFIADLVKKYSCKKVLDYGSSNCYLNKFFNNKKVAYIGIDKDPELKKKEKIYSKNFYLIKNFNFKKYYSYFDCIVLSHVIGHIYSPNQILQKIINLLKKNGIIILVTPNKYYKIFYTIINLFNNYMPDLTISRYYSIKSLENLLNKNSFKIIENFSYSITKKKITKNFLNSRVLVIGKK